MTTLFTFKERNKELNNSSKCDWLELINRNKHQNHGLNEYKTVFKIVNCLPVHFSSRCLSEKRAVATTTYVRAI